jgi:predicted nucleotidyltransferase
MNEGVLAQGPEPKKDRMQRVINSGYLETHRFMLPKNPELLERLHQLQDIVKEMKADDPAVISFALKGSFIKGYAAKESDIDGELFVDWEKANEHFKKLGLMEENEVWSSSEFIRRYNEKIRSTLQERMGLKKSQVEHTYAEMVSKHDLKKLCEGAPYQVDTLQYFFMMAVGSSDIREYRKVILDALAEQGEKGEWKWRRIMKNLHRNERSDVDDFVVTDEDLTYKNHDKYPDTIEKARAYFL